MAPQAKTVPPPASINHRFHHFPAKFPVSGRVYTDCVLFLASPNHPQRPLLNPSSLASSHFPKQKHLSLRSPVTSTLLNPVDTSWISHPCLTRSLPLAFVKPQSPSFPLLCLATLPQSSLLGPFPAMTLDLLLFFLQTLSSRAHTFNDHLCANDSIFIFCWDLPSKLQIHTYLFDSSTGSTQAQNGQLNSWFCSLI